MVVAALIWLLPNSIHIACHTILTPLTTKDHQFLHHQCSPLSTSTILKEHRFLVCALHSFFPNETKRAAVAMKTTSWTALIRIRDEHAVFTSCDDSCYVRRNVMVVPVDKIRAYAFTVTN